MKLKFLILTMLLLSILCFNFAQEPQSNPLMNETKTSVEPAGEENMVVEGETLYKHIGERDPFSPLIKSGKGGGSAGVIVKRGTAGLSQYTLDQCILEAIVKVGGEEVAWFQGPNMKPYKAKIGEVFADGVILDISYERGEVIIQQELDDPTQIKPFRNVVLKIKNVSKIQEGEAQ